MRFIRKDDPTKYLNVFMRQNKTTGSSFLALVTDVTSQREATTRDKIQVDALNICFVGN